MLWVLLGGLLASSAAAETPAVDVTISLHPESKSPVPRAVRFRAVDGDAYIRVVIASVGKTEVRLPPETSWVATAEPGDHWVAPGPYVVPKADGTWTLRSWPGAVMSGKATSEIPLPVSLRVEVRSPPGTVATRAVPPSTVDCQLGADGNWSCPIPAVEIDAVLRAKGAIPLYLWSVNTKSATAVSIPPLRFRRGSSVVAWLSTGTLRKLKAPARAKLTHVVTANAPSATTARLAIPVAESVFDRRGFVQLAPVPAGKYALEVSATGFAPSTVFPVEVMERSESVIRHEIELAPPVTARFTIDPPADDDEKPWTLRLMRRSDLGSVYNASTPSIGASNASGVIELPNIAPGKFFVHLSNSRGDEMLAKEIEITGAADANQQISLKLVEVRGKVTVASAPFAAKLWFGGRQSSISVRITSDANGSFRGRLPRAGSWPVDVDAADNGLRTRTTVEVKEGKEVEIDLPANSLAGRVITSSGEPASGATVHVNAAVDRVTAVADANGAFRLQSVPVGPLSIHAVGRDRAQSPATKATLGAREHLDGIVLRIAAEARFRAQLVAASGPVAGARVRIHLLESGFNQIVQAVSSLDGSIDADVPDGASMIVVVSSGGRALKAYRVSASRPPATLNVPDSGGTVVVTLPRPGGFLLTQDGIPVPFGDVATWAMGHGEAILDRATIRIPDVAPGFYRACVPPDGKPRCAEGTVGLGTTLTLDLTR